MCHQTSRNSFCSDRSQGFYRHFIFQKRRYQTVGDEPEWVNIAQEANMYFGTHLNHMLGRMMEESGPYGKRFVCKEKEGMDWKACIDNFHLESYLKVFMNQVRQLRITMKNMFRQ